MHTEIDVHAYVQDLEKHLQLSLFGGGTADPEGAVLLVRGALAEGDQRKAADLAESTQRLATTTPGNRDMAAAADHARGLVEQNPATLERAAVSYSAALTRARALRRCRERLGRARRSGQRGGPATSGLYPLRTARCCRWHGEGTAQHARGGHPPLPLEPRGQADLRLGQPDRHRAADRRPGGPGAQQPPGGEPGIPEPAHRRLSPAPRLLEARHQLPGASRADGRREGHPGHQRSHGAFTAPDTETAPAFTSRPRPWHSC